MGESQLYTPIRETNRKFYFIVLRITENVIEIGGKTVGDAIKIIHFTT